MVRTSFSNKKEPRRTSIFDIRAHLNANLPGRWLGRFSQSDSPFLTWPPWSPDLTPLQFFSYGVTSRNVSTCPLYHVVYHSGDKGSWRQSLLSTNRCCNLCGRELIAGLTSATSPRVDISSACKVRQKFWVFLPLLTSSPSARPLRLLYRRGRNSWRDLRITLYWE